MKKMAILAVAAFGISLAVIVGTRMNTEAMAVLIGVVCGVAAGVPASILIALVTNRRAQSREYPMAQRDYPPVVIVQPNQPSPAYTQLPYLSSAYAPSMPREFRVVGQEGTVVPEDVGILR